MRATVRARVMVRASGWGRPPCLGAHWDEGRNGDARHTAHHLHAGGKSGTANGDPLLRRRAGEARRCSDMKLAAKRPARPVPHHGVGGRCVGAGARPVQESHMDRARAGGKGQRTHGVADGAVALRVRRRPGFRTAVCTRFIERAALTRGRPRKDQPRERAQVAEETPTVDRCLGADCCLLLSNSATHATRRCP